MARLLFINSDIRTKRALAAWGFISLCAIISLFAQPLVLLMMLTLIGIPFAILINFAPGLWIYVTPILATCLIAFRFLNGAPKLVVLAIAVIPPLSAGYLIADWANRQTERDAEGLIAEDHGSPPILPRGFSITHAIDHLSTSDECSDLCLRLLMTGTAKSFVEVPLNMLSMQAALPAPLRRYWLSKISPKCDNARLPPQYLTRAQFQADAQTPAVLLAQNGLCLHDETVRDARSDVLVVERSKYTSGPDSTTSDRAKPFLSLHHIRLVERREVFQRTPAGYARIMRRTFVRYGQLSKPLWLFPEFSFDVTSPTQWGWSGERTVGSPITAVKSNRWAGIIGNDLSVSGLD